MKKSLLVLIVLFALTLPAMASEKVRTIKKNYPSAQASELSLDVPVGDVHLKTYDGQDVQVEMTITCRSPGWKCKDKAERIELVSRVTGRELKVEVKGYPKHSSHGLNLDLEVRLPAQMAFHLELGVGDVKVSGVEKNLSLKIGVGDVTVDMPSPAVRSVELDAGVGDADLRVDGRRMEGSGFIGKSLSWSAGKGSARIKVEVGVGDVGVRLR